jgi:hypothetical protein
MTRKLSIEWPFFILGTAYWLYCRDTQPMTLLTVFYSFFVGTVWGGIPTVSRTEPMTLRHILPPFILVALMMVSTNMKTVASSEFIALTAMALIHLRAAVLSVTRLGMGGLRFTVVQGIGFLIVIADLFQSNLLPFLIPQSVFFFLMSGLLAVSVTMLFWMKRMAHAKGENNVGSHRIDSGMLS